MAARRFLGVRQRLLDSNTVARIQRIQRCLLLGVIKILDQINNIVGLQLSHRFGKFRGRKAFDNLLAQAFVQLRQDVTIHAPLPDRQQITPVAGVDQLDQVGNISGVQRIKNCIDAVCILRRNSL